MNKDGIFALYARVSSDKQATDKTIDSQIAALKEKIVADGGMLIEDMMFIDAGVSGATLVRPELERLRDSAAVGAVDRVYLLSPDRLARKYAHQALLLEEFSSAGVAVHFLNHAVGTTPEEELLLQMQGMIAEYERAKIIERTVVANCIERKAVASTCYQRPPMDIPISASNSMVNRHSSSSIYSKRKPYGRCFAG